MLDVGSQAPWFEGDIGLADGGARDDESAGFGETEGDVVEWCADEIGLGAGYFGAVVSNAATFGGAIEIVNLEIRLRVDGGFEFKRERSACGDGNGEVGRNGFALVPGFPKGGDGRQGDGVERFGGAKEEFRERSGQEDEWDSMQEQRQDEIREPVRMREGDAGEVR